MCGISIAVNTHNHPVSLELIRAMNEKILHRGPDDEGFYFGDNFAFGHRRLSIIELSAAGHQPMQRKHLNIIYNGEVYNYLELREELKGLGLSFNTNSDTEVILAAYEHWGVDAFARMNGMWAFAIHDSKRNEIVFCRDHFGIKPLYFTTINDWFVAGSELKQFTAVPGFKPVLNKEITLNFLARGWLNYSDQTFFKGVNEIRPGHYVKYDLASHEVQVKQWYDLAKAAVPVNDSFEEAVGKVRHLLNESIRIRMRSDVRVGSCLSGGLDSSSIVATIHATSMANGDFATITSCYTDKRYDEQHFSDQVTSQTGFRAIKVFPDLNNLLDNGDMDKMIYHQDQPFSEASHYSEFKVFEAARANGMIVMQDGQGSDEYLCGYGEFFLTRMNELLSSFRLGEAIRMLRWKASHRKTGFGTELNQFIRRAYLVKLLKVIKHGVGRSDFPWLSNTWKAMAAKSLLSFDASNVRDLSINEIEHSSIPYQLHSEDRNSMLFSIESRLPFLDPRLVEYGIGLPSAYKMKDGYTKAVLREAVTDLPPAIKVRKDKMGFVAPDALWVLQNKERIRADLELIVTSMGIFSDELIKRFDLFTEGKLCYEPIYFRAMTLSRFCRIFKMTLD